MNEEVEKPPRELKKIIIDTIIVILIITTVIIIIAVGNEFVIFGASALGGILVTIFCIIRLKIGVSNKYIKILMIAWVVIIIGGGVILLVILLPNL